MPARSHDQQIALGGGSDKHFGGRSLDDLALDLDSHGLARQVGERAGAFGGKSSKNRRRRNAGG